MKKRDPETAEEWQEAVDAAYFVLVLDSCRQYGLIEWDGKPDIERCLKVLEEGKRRGYTPKKIEE
jgi:hypothetical protein